MKNMKIINRLLSKKSLFLLFVTSTCLLIIILNFQNVYTHPIKNVIYRSFRPKCECQKNKIVELVYHNSTHFSVYLAKDGRKYFLYSLEKAFLNNSNFTCNMYTELLRGPKQKVLSFSLYGTDKFYYEKLKDILIKTKEFYPDWFIRIYYDDSIDKSFICELECFKDENGILLNIVDFCDITRLDLIGDSGRMFLNVDYIFPMKWRFLPVGDSFVDIFASRDTDSYIIQREIDSVNAWLKGKMPGHIMRDNPYHKTAILGGMWGFKNSLDHELAKELFEKIISKDLAKLFYVKSYFGAIPKGADQTFLEMYVYPWIKDKSIVHDSYSCSSYGGSPFPTKRIGNCFAACQYICNETATFYPCPIECRPEDHQDWLYC